MRSETAGLGDVRAAAAPRVGDGTVARDDLAVAGGSQEFSAEAFTRLYEESHGRIYNLAARILNDRDQAADVTQDVFLATYKRLPELPQDVNMERWMYRVTVNACFDLMRRRHRRGEPVAHDVDDLPDHMDAYERADLTRAVESALSALSPRHRTALVLKDLHGFGNGEIAEIMGISRGSAGVLLLRARAAFRRAFGHAQPAGGKSVAGLGLAVLPMLPIPAALEAPSFLTGSALATAALAPSAAASLGALASSGAAPAVAGIGGGLGAATVAKVALVAVGAFALVGGGIAAVTTQPDSDGRSAGAEVAGATVSGTTANGNNHFAPRDDLAAERLQRERTHTDSDAEGGSGGARDGAAGDGGRGATQSGGSWSSAAAPTDRRGEGSGSESGGSGSSGTGGADGGGASAADQSGAAGAAEGTSSGEATAGGSESAGGGGSL
jgi:RNA polymerase sigma-70 factor (ECF subfamily)